MPTWHAGRSTKPRKPNSQELVSRTSRKQSKCLCCQVSSRQTCCSKAHCRIHLAIFSAAAMHFCPSSQATWLSYNDELLWGRTGILRTSPEHLPILYIARPFCSSLNHCELRYTRYAESATSSGLLTGIDSLRPCHVRIRALIVAVVAVLFPSFLACWAKGPWLSSSAPESLDKVSHLQHRLHKSCFSWRAAAADVYRLLSGICSPGSANVQHAAGTLLAWIVHPFNCVAQRRRTSPQPKPSFRRG